VPKAKAGPRTSSVEMETQIFNSNGELQQGSEQWQAAKAVELRGFWKMVEKSLV